MPARSSAYYRHTPSRQVSAHAISGIRPVVSRNRSADANVDSNAGGPAEIQTIVLCAARKTNGDPFSAPKWTPTPRHDAGSIGPSLKSNSLFNPSITISSRELDYTLDILTFVETNVICRIMIGRWQRNRDQAQRPILNRCVQRGFGREGNLVSGRSAVARRGGLGQGEDGGESTLTDDMTSVTPVGSSLPTLPRTRRRCRAGRGLV